jgi:hypothetical protein
VVLDHTVERGNPADAPPTAQRPSSPPSLLVRAPMRLLAGEAITQPRERSRLSYRRALHVWTNLIDQS